MPALIAFQNEFNASDQVAMVKSIEKAKTVFQVTIEAKETRKTAMERVSFRTRLVEKRTPISSENLIDKL